MARARRTGVGFAATDGTQLEEGAADHRGMSFPRQVVAGRVYLVTRRCTQRRFLLRPDDDTNAAFLYCLGYAAKQTSIGVVAFLASTNHYHAVIVDTKGLIPEFLESFHKLLAKHQNVLRKRRENMWSNEQTSLVELAAPEDVIAKVIYTLGNPVKDHLVERAHQWPGASSRVATLEGRNLVARRPAHFFRQRGRMPEVVELQCVRPPMLDDMAVADYRSVIRAGLERAEVDAAAERKRTGRRVLGPQGVLAQDPEDRPSTDKTQSGLKPRIAARNGSDRVEAVRRSKEFRGEYEAARSTWLTGGKVLFPVGTWWLRKYAAVVCVPEPSSAAPPKEAGTHAGIKDPNSSALPG